jgi:NADH dehydrogenase FAD-containing subunit
MNFDLKDHAAMSLRSWVNVIIGKMTWIDRRRKHIVINGQTVLPYDHLILCTGEQYYNIAPHNARVYNSYTKQEVKPFSGRPLFGIKNIFSLIFLIML